MVSGDARRSGGLTADERAASSLSRAKSVGIKAWAAIGCAVVFVLATLALGKIWGAVELLLVGALFGFICSPMTNGLERHGVPRGLAALAALLVMVAALVVLLVLLFPPFVREAIEVLQQVPSYVSQARGAIASFWDAYGSSKTSEVQQNLDQMVNAASNLGISASSDLLEKLSSGLMDNVMSLFSNTVTLFLGLVLGYWFAKDYPRIAREFRIVAGPDHERSLSVMLCVMSRSMGGYMRGIVITSLLDGILSFVGFSLIGNPYAGLMATLAGVLHFVPVIGPWVSAAMATSLALFVGPLLAIETLMVAVIATNVVDNVISPLVMQSAVKVHPALSLLGIMVGSALGGTLGMILAIPLTAAIRSVFVYYFESRSGRQLVSYDGALFRSTPFHDGEGKILPAYDALDDDAFFENTLLVDREDAPHSVPADRPSPVRRTLAERVLAVAGREGRARARAPRPGSRPGADADAHNGENGRP